MVFSSFNSRLGFGCVSISRDGNLISKNLFFMYVFHVSNLHSYTLASISTSSLKLFSQSRTFYSQVMNTHSFVCIKRERNTQSVNHQNVFIDPDFNSTPKKCLQTTFYRGFNQLKSIIHLIPLKWWSFFEEELIMSSTTVCVH